MTRTFLHSFDPPADSPVTRTTERSHDVDVGQARRDVVKKPSRSSLILQWDWSLAMSWRNRLLPTFDSTLECIGVVLSANGRKFYECPNRHPSS